ncbi:MAG: UDP-N-acetylglucosamine 2-epimerase (non-hydrolyzing) [Bacteroidia bacterium]|nr:UDP-N-acetylglucosamine 2-epimerase (non-hydrolyzing) [Bacteroidia bacterium]NND51954.1 UDP-N-acetylglucosamine 2-epimerase (non-hydrolyzing) [Flavobacteriaceae bacterium]
MKLTIVAGARPNFMKIAPLIKAIRQRQNDGASIAFRLVHTGQHYDKNLSDTFFEELGIPFPDVNLNVKSGSQAEQAAGIMIAFETDLREHPTDLVIVVGDVTSTMACAVVAKKEGVRLAHIEAGIRSGDMRMPEEINRIVTDSLSDYFFTTTIYANENLKSQGASEDQIFFVGNIMIDTLLQNKDRFFKPDLWDSFNLVPKKYLVMTLHRPSNVDEELQLKSLVSKIVSSSKGLPIIFPVHPRTKLVLEKLDLNFETLHFVDPLGYLQFNYLVQHALGVLTDSGGITEETTVLNVPCITLRENTERPETCEMGTNVLVGNDLDLLAEKLSQLLSGQWKSGEIPELWDGHTAERIVDHLIEIYGS